MECPQEESDCRYACIAAGFRAESFGAAMVLHPLYEDACPCMASTFASAHLVADVRDEVSFADYEFQVSERAQLAGGVIPLLVLNGAFLGSFLPAGHHHDAANTSALAPNTSVPALLRPWDASGAGTMLLDIGPGVCVYRMSVTLGSLLNVSADPSFTGILASGGAAASPQQPGTGSTSREPAGGLDRESPASGDEEEAAGEGGNGSEASGLQAVTVAEAEAVALGLSVAVGAAVGMAVVAALAGTVAAAVTNAGPGTAPGVSGGGGAAMGLIEQAQTIALFGRVGGPGAQPNATQALADGMAWTNGHIFTLASPSDADSATGRRAGGGEEYAVSYTHLRAHETEADL
eukprot:3847204-Rhodomonas_salina.1